MTLFLHSKVLRNILQNLRRATKTIKNVAGAGNVTYASVWECFSKVGGQPWEENEEHPGAAELADKHRPTSQHQ